MKKIINQKNNKVHYLRDEHTTLCGISDNGIKGYEKPIWIPTDKDVDCKLCLKKMA